MPPASESKSAQPNIQDVFLNYVRREKLSVKPVSNYFSHQ